MPTRISTSWMTKTSRFGPLALAAALAVASLPGTPAAAEEDPAAAATSSVSEIMDRVLAIGREAGLSPAEKRARIEEIAVEKFAWTTMSRLVLARNWRKLSEPQQAEFVEEFRKHLSLTYGRRLEQIGDERVDIGQARVASNGDVTVRTTIIGGTADGVVIDYRLRSIEGDWKAIDVIIEGVSLVSNFRSQTRDIVSSSGTDGLIAKLREKNARAAAPPAD
jgi:phospholipid transport system substrate-binding protein